MATLTLQNVAKIYPGNVRAVEDLTLQVPDGELMVLVGPSGCGKTTTLRMIAGLEPPTRGTISIDGRPINGVPPKDRDVAMVFQGQVLYPHLTVAGNMGFGLKLRRVAKSEIRRRVGEAAEVLGISELLARRPGELSGGEQQRVALGRAIVRNPKLFLFDEPLSNLEAGLRTKLRQEIRRLHARLGTTTVYVTHDQTEAMTLGQRIAVIRRGRLQQVADPATLYHRPANRFVAGLIGSPAMNFFEGRIECRGDALVFHSVGGVSDGDRTVGGVSDGDRTVGGVSDGDRTVGGVSDGEQGGFTLPIPEMCVARLRPYVGQPITLGIRPDHVGSPAAEQQADAPRIPAEVEAVEPLGPESYVYYTAGAHTFVSRVDAQHRFQIGDRATPAVATDHLHFFDPQTETAITWR